MNTKSFTGLQSMSSFCLIFVYHCKIYITYKEMILELQKSMECKELRMKIKHLPQLSHWQNWTVKKKYSCVCRSWEEISKAELFCTQLIQFLVDKEDPRNNYHLCLLHHDSGLLYPEKEIKRGPWDLGNRRLKERRGSSLFDTPNMHCFKNMTLLVIYCSQNRDCGMFSHLFPKH